MIKIFNQVVTSKKLTEIDPKQYLCTDISFKLPKGQTFEWIKVNSVTKY